MNRNSKNINLTIVGIVLFSIITIHNNSQYGAFLSWLLPACILIVIGWLFQKHFYRVTTPIAISLFWFCTFVSTALSPIVGVEQDIFSLGILFFTYYLVSSLTFDKKQINIILICYVVSALVCSLFVIKNWVVGDYYIAWTLRSSYRFLGVYKDPNYVTAYLTPAVFFSYLATIYNNGYKRLIALAVVLTFLISILCTGSRSPIVTIIAALGFFYIMDSTIKTKTKIQILIVSSFIIYIMYSIYVQIMPQQVFDRLENSTEDSRLDLWTAGTKGFINNPIIGEGFNCSNLYASKIVGNYCHSIFVDILSSSGLVGFFLFIYIIIKNCMNSNLVNRKFIYTIIIVFMLPLAFINGYATGTFFTPLIMMTILSHYCIRPDTKFIDLFKI